MVKFDQMWFIFQHAVHTLLPTVLQRLDSQGREALILIREKVLSCRYDLITGQILLPSQVGFLGVFFFSFWGTENSLMMTNQENMEGNQPVQSHRHAQQPLQLQACVEEHCPGETGFPSSVFQAILKCLYYYFSKSWITYPVWAYLEGNNSVSIRKGWI